MPSFDAADDTTRQACYAIRLISLKMPLSPLRTLPPSRQYTPYCCRSPPLIYTDADSCLDADDILAHAAKDAIDAAADAAANIDLRHAATILTRCRAFTPALLRCRVSALAAAAL